MWEDWNSQWNQSPIGQWLIPHVYAIKAFIKTQQDEVWRAPRMVIREDNMAALYPLPSAYPPPGFPESHPFIINCHQVSNLILWVLWVILANESEPKQQVLGFIASRSEVQVIPGLALTAWVERVNTITNLWPLGQEHRLKVWICGWHLKCVYVCAHLCTVLQDWFLNLWSLLLSPGR